MRVLVVDDADDLLDLIQLVLEDRGWLVHTAENAKEALMLIPQGYDLLLLDRNLPDMSEADFLSKVEDVRNSAEIIQMTADRGVKPVKFAVGLLEKPLDPTLLASQIEAILAQAGKAHI